MDNHDHAEPEQRAAVDQSADVRDPADDSDLVNDPEALTQTYPGAFGGDRGDAERAIERERSTTHSPRDQSRSTDNDRERQITPGPVIVP